MANLFGANPIKGKKRQTKAETIVGEAKYAQQKRRNARSKQAAIASGKSTDKASTLEVMKRMKEYKTARGDYKAPKRGRKKK
jgi:hypothetical protein